MKIANYTIQSRSAHSLQQQSEVRESLQIWKGGRQTSITTGEDPSFDVRLSSNAPRFTGSKTIHSANSASDSQKESDTATQIRLIESFIYALTGKRVKLHDPGDMDLGGEGQDTQQASSAAQGGQQGWGVRYDYSRTYAEAESVQFSSQGSVTTADGRSISFKLDFAMSRAYYQSESFSLRLGDAAKTDPLVIAYGGGAPQLTAAKTAFDLDADGDLEHISFATGGSGFLALDKNGDGAINNGSELFGPQSGDGFKELRAYDLDRNGWIDENDAVFGKLSIYTMDSEGQKTLFSLGELGIGAIYLGESATQFDFKDGAGASSGEMTATSVFLREDGTAGTIHHINLSI